MYPDDDFDAEDISGGTSDSDSWNAGNQARHSFDNSGYEFPWGDSSQEEALSEYWLHESFLRTEWEGDGIAEL